MFKKVGKILTVVLSTVMILAIGIMLSACGDSTSGTYKLELSAETLNADVNNGFIKGMIAQKVVKGQTNTLELDNGKYKLTKEVNFDTTVPAAGGQEMVVRYVFEGTYTVEEDVITLSSATYATALEKWGVASAYAGEKDTNSDEDAEILGRFSTPYYDDIQYCGNSAQKVKINKDNSTYAYVE